MNLEDLKKQIEELEHRVALLEKKEHKRKNRYFIFIPILIIVILIAVIIYLWIWKTGIDSILGIV